MTDQDARPGRPRGHDGSQVGAGALDRCDGGLADEEERCAERVVEEIFPPHTKQAAVAVCSNDEASADEEHHARDGLLTRRRAES